MSNAPATPRSLPQLPPNVLFRIVELVNPLDLPSIRLASCSLCFLSSSLLSSITLPSSALACPRDFSRLQHVTKLNFELSGPVMSWQGLESAVRQLPALQHLSAVSRRMVNLRWTAMPPSLISALSSSLTRLDLSMTTPHDVGAAQAVRAGAQLPRLRALSFRSIHDLAPVASLAPQLQQLHCEVLVLSAPAAPDEAMAALPRCTHLSSDQVILQGALPASALAAAFPAVRVVAQLPQVSDRRNLLQPVGAVLRPWASSLTALRLRGTRAFMHKVPEQLRCLTGLQRLCIFELEERLLKQLRGLASALPSLTHLMITFLVARLRPPAKLLVHLLGSEAAALPRLAALAMPAPLLCASCSPKLASSLRDLAQAQPRIQLVGVGCCRHCGSHSTPRPGPWPASAASSDGTAAAAAAAASAQPYCMPDPSQATVAEGSVSGLLAQAAEAEAPRVARLCLLDRRDPLARGHLHGAGSSRGQLQQQQQVRGVWGDYGPADVW